MKGRLRHFALMAWPFLMPSVAMAREPDCTAPDAWPAAMAAVHLKNAGLLAAGGVDASRTQVTRLASERLARNRYRQVHRVSLTSTGGDPLTVITVNEASLQECSLSSVAVYVVSRQLGDPIRP